MNLFTPLRLGRLELPNRIVMAPMTRSRATGGVPNELMRDYYAQRAGAGLIVTEGTAPSANALGYARIPGLFSSEQIAGWQKVNAAVHEAGGRIVAQLMHTGRIGHPANLPSGAGLVAPSAIRATGTMYTDELGPQPMPTPEALTDSGLNEAREQFVQAARRAIQAGFDGVELHAANGYLLEQFLNPHSNARTDAYGGSAEKRNRFVIEVAEAASEAIGEDRVGIRLSPYNTFNDLRVFDEIESQYTSLVRSLPPLLYVHVVKNRHPGFGTTVTALRAAFDGPLILNGGFDREQAEQTIAAGDADLISFGSSFIANPDLVTRLQLGAPLASPDPSTFYTPGPRGYTDYPLLTS